MNHEGAKGTKKRGGTRAALRTLRGGAGMRLCGILPAMRVHPISIALRYLKGQRTFRAAPYYGRAPFRDDTEAVALLRRLTGRNFGTDAAAWGKWLRFNRSVYKKSS